MRVGGDQVTEDHLYFEGSNSVSLSTIDHFIECQGSSRTECPLSTTRKDSSEYRRVLRPDVCSLSQECVQSTAVYSTAPVGLSASLNKLYFYIQRVFQLETLERPCEYIFTDESEFHLAKKRRKGQTMIGQRGHCYSLQPAW